LFEVIFYEISSKRRTKGTNFKTSKIENGNKCFHWNVMVFGIEGKGIVPLSFPYS